MPYPNIVRTFREGSCGSSPVIAICCRRWPSGRRGGHVGSHPREAESGRETGEWDDGDSNGAAGRGGKVFLTGLDDLDALAAAGGVRLRGGSRGPVGTRARRAAVLRAAAGPLGGGVAGPGGGGAVVWSDPRHEAYPPALAAGGLPLERVVLLRPRSAADEVWALAECLRCRGVAAVVAAPPALSRVQARRLQLAAEHGGGGGGLPARGRRGEGMERAGGKTARNGRTTRPPRAGWWGRRRGTGTCSGGGCSSFTATAGRWAGALSWRCLVELPKPVQRCKRPSRCNRPCHSTLRQPRTRPGGSCACG